MVGGELVGNRGRGWGEGARRREEEGGRKKEVEEVRRKRWQDKRQKKRSVRGIASWKTV